MRWDDLRYVLAVQRRGSLTAAAAELGVTHTTVGRRLRSLEDQLGVRLFERTPEGIHLITAGQDLLAVAERMEAELHGAERRLMGQDADLRGALRVSLFDFLLWACAPALAAFTTEYPHVELTLNADLDPVSLPRREADVAMRLTDTPPETLIGRNLGSLGFAVYASEDLVSRVGADAPYAAYPWIGMDTSLDGGWLDAWLAEHAPGARIAVRIDENALLRRQAIRSGMGAFFLPTYEGDALPELRRLGPVHFTRGLWLLSHPELRGCLRVRAFTRHMAEALSDLGDPQKSTPTLSPGSARK